MPAANRRQLWPRVYKRHALLLAEAAGRGDRDGASCHCHPHTACISRAECTYHLTGIQPAIKFTVSKVRQYVQTTKSWPNNVAERQSGRGKWVTTDCWRRCFASRTGTTRSCLLPAGRPSRLVVRSSGRYVAQNFSVTLPCSVADRSRGTARSPHSKLGAELAGPVIWVRKAPHGITVARRAACYHSA
jgi:hypothetical protein